MDKVNFDSLQRIKAPQAWLEKAAAVPGTCAPKRRITFPIYRVVAAASVVLVSMVGLLVFLFFGNSGSVPVIVPNSGSTATEIYADETVVGDTTKTDASVPTAETIAVLATEEQDDTALTYQDRSAPTLCGTQPTDGRGSLTSPSSLNVPVPARGADQPTQGAIQPTQSVPQPTANADGSGASDPTQPPADPTVDTVPTEAAMASEEGESDHTLIAQLRYGEGAYVFANGEAAFFCRYYDASGQLLGSGDLYAAEKKTTLVSCQPDGSVVVSYNPDENGLPIVSGRYEYVFYDRSGTELTRGTVLY